MRDIIREVLQKSDHELKEFLLSNLNDDVYWDKSFNEIKTQYDAKENYLLNRVMIIFNRYEINKP